MSYSQNEEETVILDFFKNQAKAFEGVGKGRVLEIGAYHPLIFSNSRRLIELGWEAVLVEASPKCFTAFETEYKNNPKVKLVNKAIGATTKKLKFYDSAGAVGTAFDVHYNKWKELQLDYEEITVDCVSWKDFYAEYPGKYDFISIDTEGMDYEILNQIDLHETETKLICVEYTYANIGIEMYLKHYGFKTLFVNTENIIAWR